MAGDSERDWERVQAPEEGEPVIAYVHDPDPSQDDLDAAKALILLAAEKLGPLEARLLHLRYEKHFTIRRIAAIEGVSPMSVSTRLREATRRLRAAIRLPIPDLRAVKVALDAVVPPDTALVVLAFISRRNQVYAARQLQRSQPYIHRHLQKAKRVLKSEAPHIHGLLDTLQDRATYAFVADWRGR